MIDNLLKEGGGILRRLPSAAMAIMLAVTLAIPQGLALADPAPVSEDVEAFGHANSEAQPVISESNTSTEMADKSRKLPLIRKRSLITQRKKTPCRKSRMKIRNL